ncbi:MAG: contractile injection system protein, VgrG/Pvc8 family [Desulfovibrionaceae bacterium]
MSNYTGQNPLVTLKVNGKIHRGWLSCSIQLNLDALAGAFSLSLSHRWLEGGKVHSLHLDEGAPCTLDVDGQTVVTGYIVDVNPSFAATAHQITVQGADKAADLVDCSAPVKDWHGRSLEQIAGDICAPFGIKLHCLSNTGAVFSKFATNPGDTCASTLERLLRQRGLWAWSDGVGGLNIGAPALHSPVETLARGKNILSGQTKRSMAERFSTYAVMGQHNPAAASADNDADDTPAPKLHPTGTAQDKGVSRYRPLLIVAEAEGGGPSFGVRAHFEARVRAAKGHKPVIQVQGWRTAQGLLWQAGQTVTMDDDWLGVEGPWLISNVEFSQSGNGGSTTRLSLSKAEAFDLLPQPEKAKKKKQSDDDDE